MITDAERERLDRDFIHHTPKGDQSGRYTAIRNITREVALYFMDHCPDSQERSLAITKLEEAVFWANASIARNE